VEARILVLFTQNTVFDIIQGNYPAVDPYDLFFPRAGGKDSELPDRLDVGISGQDQLEGLGIVSIDIERIGFIPVQLSDIRVFQQPQVLIKTGLLLFEPPVVYHSVPDI